MDNATHETLITIGLAANKLDVSVSTLRMYEAAGVIITHRTETGRRMFSLADLERISKIRKLIKDEGLNLAGIRRLMALIPCWEKGQCASNGKVKCIVYNDSKAVCWMLPGTLCKQSKQICRTCQVYLDSCDSIDNLLPLIRDAE